jgi:two-component system, chemotaxis family, sensor kinase CheA
MDETLQQFLIEGRELIYEAHRSLGALARDPADMHALDSAFRAVHTLKGSVAIFDMRPAEQALHAAEDVLSVARQPQHRLASAQLSALTSCIDQIERWIDAVERGEYPATDTESLGTMLIGLLRRDRETPATAPETTDTPPPWVDNLIARNRVAIAEAAGDVIAFRHTPDPDCFFRGEDPLALIAAVPGLLSVTIHPIEAWPELTAMDPFRCALVVEGLSTGSLPDLRAVFRLVPDQIAFGAVSKPRAGSQNEPVAAPAIRTLRVDTARLDHLGEDLGELVIATNRLALLADRADDSNRELAGDIRAAQFAIERATARLRRSATALRQVPLAPALGRLPRLVREIADELGKPVRFEMHGERLEVDKDIADGLFEPLLHLARNAIDHGIEPAEFRRKQGKPADGRLTLRTDRHENEIVVAFEDDGGGVDPERIRQVAIERGTVTAHRASALTSAQLQDLIFAPGFSTANAVTGISGRGMGMDAVRASVDRLRGRVELDSRVGEGSRFLLRFPVNAMTTRTLVVTVGADRYAVPFDQIRETVRVGRDRLLEVGTGRACVLRDRTVPILGLAKLLGEAETLRSELKLLVTDIAGGSVALLVDDFGQAMDTVVRPRVGLLAGTTWVQGTTLGPDGGVLLVLDLLELIG